MFTRFNQRSPGNEGKHLHGNSLVSKEDLLPNYLGLLNSPQLSVFTAIWMDDGFPVV